MSPSSTSPSRPTSLVTGASSGIGLAVARLLVERGHRVVGTSRDPDRLSAQDRVPGVEYRALDLDDLDAVGRFAAGLLADGVEVDVLVNNAGESQCGALEELPLPEVEHLFRVNVLGPVHLTQLLVPGMRERGRGRVVMVGSMLATFPLAYRSSYVATKAAIKGFAEAARFELSPHGVWLTTVEPGSVATGISGRRTVHSQESGPYAAGLRQMLHRLDAAERDGVSAARVAATVLRAVEADPPAPTYAVGSGAPAVHVLRRALPGSVVERVVARRFGLGQHGVRG
ncbi:SDR family oxidoreductase [Nocardioides aurantiacus]|uniref:Short-subunit dehydrogenase n=1 Tax=Nocardioides aurantiacus TaxID=86796 RepID=A0A3N2CTB3_9ACTN|nr:SDR family oxidoreductase [Nocardioides aurantiacus]ROR90777.1 short-subunit dehydrogenase [Nocardioides aurantiacus]